MNDLAISPFQFEGRNVRLIDQDGETWFVATDVARELGYEHTPHLLRTLDDDEKGVHKVDTLGGEQEKAIISEPGLYCAIIQRRANKKHDRAITDKIARFQRWVFHDILPTIRKTGRYEAAPLAPSHFHPALPDFTKPAIAARAWAEQVEGREIAEKQVAVLDARVCELAPKADALDLIASASGSLCITDAAKLLKMRPKALFEWMERHSWIYRRLGTPWLGYQDKLSSDLLWHKATTIERTGEPRKVLQQVRITPKGLAALARALPNPALTN